MNFVFLNVNFRMTRVLDRVQSQSMEESHGNDTTNDMEKMVTEEVNSDKLEIECSATADLEHIELEYACVASVSQDKVVDNEMTSGLVQPSQDEADECSENILQSIIEVAVEMGCEQQVLNSDKTMNSESQLSSLNHQSISSGHIDDLAVISNALEVQHTENSSMYSSGEVSTIVENAVVVPIQIPDLLMNLNPATKNHEVSSSLKRKSSDETDHELEAKKHKEDDNNSKTLLRLLFYEF